MADASWPRCSPLTRSLGVDPVGTAGSYDVFVLVEQPLPWPPDVGDHPALAPLAAAVRDAAGAGVRWRVQGLVPPDPAAPGRRVVVWRLGAPGEPGYRRAEAVVPAAEAAEAAVALARGRDGETAAEGTPLADVLICTHGARDACCGGRGTGLWQEARDRLGVAGAGGREVRLWRTSHTGGHRFAPTGFTFPAGQCWAWLDAGLLERVVAQEGPVAGLERHYRGCAAMATPALQALEREAFLREGWAWLGFRRWGEQAPAGEGATSVRLRFEAPGGRSGVYEATVVVERLAPVPACGRPPEEATKREPELRVAGLRTPGTG